VWPLAARAQQMGKVPRIGYLGSSSPSLEPHFVEAFRQKLRSRRSPGRRSSSASCVLGSTARRYSNGLTHCNKQQRQRNRRLRELSHS
jgi:hypothetical protein